MVRSVRRLLYSPQYVQGYAVAMLRASADLALLRKDLELERRWCARKSAVKNPISDGFGLGG